MEKKKGKYQKRLTHIAFFVSQLDLLNEIGIVNSICNKNNRFYQRKYINFYYILVKNIRRMDNKWSEIFFFPFSLINWHHTYIRKYIKCNMHSTSHMCTNLYRILNKLFKRHQQQLCTALSSHQRAKLFFTSLFSFYFFSLYFFYWC